jgi:hypothetical protein
VGVLRQQALLAGQLTMDARALLLACIVTPAMLVPFIARHVARSLAAEVLKGRHDAAWRRTCALASLRYWVVLAAGTEAVAIAFAAGFDSELAKAVPVALFIGFIGAAAWERSRDVWIGYWIELHDSLEHAVASLPEFAREPFNLLGGRLTGPPRDRPIALRRILDETHERSCTGSQAGMPAGSP